MLRFWITTFTNRNRVRRLIAYLNVTGGSMSTTVSRKRSIAKAISYRIIIVCLDFVVVYLLTGQVRMAVGFMIVSNVYTTLGYFLHERAWAHIAWGRQIEPAG